MNGKQDGRSSTGQQHPPMINWWVEPFAGTAVGGLQSKTVHPKEVQSDLMVQCGALLASIHKIDTAWFDPHREAMCDEAPSLRTVATNSHAWFYAAWDNYAEKGATGIPGGLRAKARQYAEEPWKTKFSGKCEAS
jgi:hypothetical protein